tara:strand:- start:264 stop:683 length:420 start_codon:yes stop_codon:yes gene_type:complete
MITTENQPYLAAWLCERIGLMPSPHLRCIAHVNAAGDAVMGVVGYDGFNGASVMMHMAGTPHWIDKTLLHATFDYPFNVMGCNVVLAAVPSGNEVSLDMTKRLGFKTLAVVEGAHPDGALHLLAMTREECKWLAPRRTH